MQRADHIMANRKQKGRKRMGVMYNLQKKKKTSSDLLPPARHHFLKFPPSPKITPPIGD
jgi:hypothetical protein